MPPRKVRSDALANRDRIAAAARAMLSAANGAPDELKLHLVARAAGVGQGTLYRNFPTREHLLAEVYAAELSELVDAVPALLGEHPPLAALAAWFDRLVEYARVKRGVVAALEPAAWGQIYGRQHGRLDTALTTLLAAGRASGEIRDDVDAADVIALLGALSRVPDDEWDVRAPRITAVVVDGLRPWRR